MSFLINNFDFNQLGIEIFIAPNAAHQKRRQIFGHNFKNYSLYQDLKVF